MTKYRTYFCEDENCELCKSEKQRLQKDLDYVQTKTDILSQEKEG